MSSLGTDLALIREQQSMSIDDVQQITKIPPPILQSIEDDSIFTQWDENITYIRSYVRSYAKAIHIDEQDIARALNEVEAGMYEGSLFEGHELDEDPDNSIEEQSNSGEVISGESTEQEDENHAPSSEKPKKERLYRSSSKQEKKKYMLSSTDKLSSVDWADIGHKAHTDESKGARWRIIWGVVLFIAVLIILFLLYNYFSGGDDNNTSQEQTTTAVQTVTPSDSLKQSLISENKTLTRADSNAFTQNGTLSDTLTLAVYAAGGKLEPVRIYTDIMGIRNPYWIEQGDTMRFNFVNTIHIRATNQYNRLQLLFNGHTIKDFYEKFYNEKKQMVELNRSLFENNAKWRSLANNSRP